MAEAARMSSQALPFDAQRTEADPVTKRDARDADDIEIEPTLLRLDGFIRAKKVAMVIRSRTTG